MKSLICAVLLLMGSMAGGFGAAAQVDDLSPPKDGDDVYARVEGLVLAHSGADQTQAGVRRTFEADGTTSDSVVSAADFLGVVRDLIGHAEGPRAQGGRAFDAAVGASAGDDSVSARLGWPFCDRVSFWVIHLGGVGESGLGASFNTVESSPVGDIGAEPVCGGFYGQTHTYQRLVLDASDLEVVEACLAAEVIAPAEVAIGTSGGYVCSGVNFAEMKGNFAITSMSVGDLTVDYALGEAGIANIGWSGGSGGSGSGGSGPCAGGFIYRPLDYDLQGIGLVGVVNHALVDPWGAADILVEDAAYVVSHPLDFVPAPLDGKPEPIADATDRHGAPEVAGTEATDASKLTNFGGAYFDPVTCKIVYPRLDTITLDRCAADNFGGEWHNLTPGAYVAPMWGTTYQWQVGWLGSGGTHEVQIEVQIWWGATTACGHDGTPGETWLKKAVTVSG